MAGSETVQITMPQMGESVSEGTVLTWHKHEGDAVEKDETVVEVSTDKVDAEVPAPTSGKLVKILAQEDETVAVGQALANLIDNAIKYSGDERALAVDARVVEGRLVIAVIDRGLGIATTEHAKIFEKFYRVGRSDTQGRRGSGVGLALVRHIVEAHRGDVTVESAPGEGSRFTLRLPLARERDG